MKRVLFFASLLVLLFLTSNITAQITITSSDVNSYLAVGNSYSGRNDTASQSVNIGSTGSFSLDYSALTFSVPTTSQSVTVSSTPYASTFPSATACIHSTIVNPLGTGDSWSFYTLATDFIFPGLAIKVNATPAAYEFINKYSPPFTAAKLPMTMGSTWTNDYLDSNKTLLGGIPISTTVTHVFEVFMVDGYGTIITPGGRSIQVLRLKQDRREVSPANGYSRSISYQYISKTGESFSVDVADTNAADNGTVAIYGLFWDMPGLTDVKDDVIAANQYSLLPNYPNPFNPSTKINYYLPRESKVTVSIYNSLGQLVQTLVNGIENSGMHELNFNAAGLASGTYLYRLNAISSDSKSSYTSSGKMVLLK
jgi:hypothetical protein